MTVRLVHLTDVHFGGEDAPAAAAAAAFVRADPPDLVVLTGDLTLNGLPREFRAARSWCASLPTPRLATPGNHDTPYWNIPLRALTPFNRYRRYIGSPDSAAFDGARAAVRMINTSRGFQPRPDWSKGAIKTRAAAEAAAALARAPMGALRVVGCHHPLVEVVGAPVTGGVYRGALAAKLLAEGGVDLILSGHVHNPFAVELPYGDGLTYAVGAGTLSLRTRGTPPSFNVIVAEAEQVTVTAMGWSGLRFELLESWTLKRRRPASGPTPA